MSTPVLKGVWSYQIKLADFGLGKILDSDDMVSPVAARSRHACYRSRCARARSRHVYKDTNESRLWVEG
eukprot:3370234-Rhodomonas_salina.3